jgi:general secretion pathway protein D
VVYITSAEGPINNKAGGAVAGTAPSYQGTPTVNNPSGIFPGAGPLGSNPGQVSPASSDGSLTGTALRTVAPNAPISAPSLATLGTVTGILTDPQFRFAIQAIEQRDGTDILSAPRVTTLSGRQAHVSVSDIVNIVVYPDIIPGGLSSLTTGTGVGSAATTSASTAPVVTYTTQPFTQGPTLDVLPTISADGYSIQMVLVPTLVEFVGYDPPGQFIPQVSSLQGIPLVAQLPLPHYRVREVVTSVNLWDGQTVLLGGLISENISKLKDKVPVLGDLPLLGRFFKSEYSYSQKANLMVFVTASIIDPAGNRVHTDEEMPFAKNSIPVQPPGSALH